jgi:hypothetical protein
LGAVDMAEQEISAHVTKMNQEHHRMNEQPFDA